MWEDQLVPFLKEQIKEELKEEASISERLVAASLKCAKQEERAGVVCLIRAAEVGASAWACCGRSIYRL